LDWVDHLAFGERKGNPRGIEPRGLRSTVLGVQIPQ
jgi:hypothetical protein